MRTPIKKIEALVLSVLVLTACAELPVVTVGHTIPKHFVILVTAAIVADGSADIFGDRVEVAEQFLDGFVGQFGVFFKGCIQVIGIRTVVRAGCQ